MNWKKKRAILSAAFGRVEVAWDNPEEFTARVRDLCYVDETGDFSFITGSGKTGEKAVTSLFNNLVSKADEGRKIVICPHFSTPREFVWKGGNFKETPNRSEPRFGD